MDNDILTGVSMKKVALIKSGKPICTAFFLALLIGLLPGCAVVGPLLSLGGFAGLAPLQYISTAYTIGEFSYEYAANDKDPGEVIEGKINAVVSGEAFEMPAYMQSDPAGPAAPVMVAEADAKQTPSMAEDARQKRIDNLMGRRQVQFERLELRRMAFLKAQSKNELSLRQTAMSEKTDLFRGAIDEVSLD
ncbi:hypothetical protein [uncultured Pseudodesulfovibrio sp.]|uniref:hypothetical protein n=1 Tax=uncultured Pseudodesulfovibrio sp. TaxID=2035858 RepID=UPI002AAB93AA|nr:hypothetical protein [uncultured Pseudodesulfovibrio sp.]